MKAVHVISDSDAPVMLGAGLYLVKAYLTAWKIVMEQKGGVGCSCGLRIWPSRKMRGPFRTRPAPSRAKSFLFKEISMQKKLLVFLVLLLILPVACMARDFDGFRADVPPGWEVMEEKGAMVGFASPDREAIVTVTVASAQDVDPAAFAAEMARGLGGSDIMEKDGVYSFAFGDNGVTVVHVAGTDLRVISIIGGHPALEGLIDSIEWR